MMKTFFGTLIAAGAFNFAAVAQSTNTMNTNQIESATFGGGCFWCMEAVYERLPGVLSVTSGYAGGHTANPTYHEVCGGATGHAEVTQIKFDATKISYAQLLDVFWQAHDPTTLNRQGADTGSQYRSAIFPHSSEQRAEAEAAIARNQTDWDARIVTTIEADAPWYKAEAYHQGYYANNAGSNGYCAAVVGPKLAKFRKGYAARLKKAA